VFEGFARSHYFLGAFGNGSKMKFVANLLVAIHNVSAAEAFVLGMKAGLARGRSCASRATAPAPRGCSRSAGL
jgi:3-hydroxyisobutyrate dehydrogenase-like beta-hydroxyacid dehydrogenase